MTPSLGWASISWIENYLVHGPGDVQGQAIDLDDEFAAFIVKAYRVNPQTGARIVRRAFLSRAKGRSKSGLAAFIECFEAIGPCRFDHFAEDGEISDWGYEYEPGEPVGRPLGYVEILNVATEESQAGNTYDAVYYILNPDTCSDALLEDYGALDVGLTRINLPGSRGFIEPVTASNESKDGGKSTFIVADETHLWIPPASGKFKLGKMHQTMVRNLLKRKQASGWMLETSTMYAEGERSVAEGTHTYAETLRKSGTKDGALLFDHRQASETWDLEKRSERIKALRQAYGPAADWMDLDALADYYDDPQASAAEFRRFFLNQPVPLEEKPTGIFPGWADLSEPRPQGPRLLALGVSTDPDQSWISLGAALAGERPHLALNDRRPATERKEFAKHVADVQRRHDGCPVSIHHKNFLIPDLEEAGVTLSPAGMDDLAQAAADMATDVDRAAFGHGDYPDLNDAQLVAKWRMLDGRRLLDGRKTDISALEAVALALAASRAPTTEPFAIWG